MPYKAITIFHYFTFQLLEQLIENKRNNQQDSQCISQLSQIHKTLISGNSGVNYLGLITARVLFRYQSTMIGDVNHLVLLQPGFIASLLLRFLRDRLANLIGIVGATPEEDNSGWNCVNKIWLVFVLWQLWSRGIKELMQWWRASTPYMFYSYYFQRPL